MADVATDAAELARQLDAAREQQRAVSDVLRAVAHSEGLESVLDAVVAAAGRLCESEASALYLTEGELLRISVMHGTPEVYEYEKDHPHVRDRSTLVGRVALTNQVVHIPDVPADADYSWEGQRVATYPRVLLGVPVLVEDELIGVLGLSRLAPKPFSDEQIELVKTFADQAAIAIANARLIEAVERQRTELSRFLSPQVAELVSSPDGERLLAGHRAYISCLFCDLRGFTAFAETAEPEELLEVLREYHAMIGDLIPRYDGTLEHFAGDGVMVFFNDPVPVEAHESQAIRLALAAQECFAELAAGWRKRGTDLGLGIGIGAGYATLGRIGFKGRYDYGALGPVTNLASRLSVSAAPGQTLISQRIYAAVEEQVEAEQVGELELKGFGRPVVAYEVQRLRT